MQDSFIKSLIQQFISADVDDYAFTLYDGETIKNISYNQFANDILCGAGYFFGNSICGKHIGLVALNIYDWLVSFFAITASGNVSVSLNPALPDDLLKMQCKIADVSVICGEQDLVEHAQNGTKISATCSCDEIKKHMPISIDSVCPTNEDTLIALVFTSGTTGMSKAVEITSGNLQSSSKSMEEMFACGNMDAVTTAIPMFHIAGLRGAVSALRLNKKLCVGRGARYMLMDMPVLKPTFAFLVPAMAENLVKIFHRTATLEDRSKYVGTELKRICIAGATLNPSVVSDLLDLGYVVDTAYGMTETIGAGMWCILDKKHINVLGKPYGDMQCRIYNGEILFKGASVMKGYYNDPEGTEQVIVDGWLYTGDMGYCDEYGYYHITGRKKNVIILSNGENVNPEEIEMKFNECKAIEECLVYSDGKGICADVFTKDTDCAGEFVKLYNKSMPLYRQVYKVNYAKEPLPKTASGKIKRKENK